MPRRHPALPRIWLMTDTRMGDRIWAALERLPRGAGVIVRHYELPLAERRALFIRVRKVARRRGLLVVRAGADRLGRGEQGVHGRRHGRIAGIRSWPVHDAHEGIAAMRAGADIVFISPVFATRSHPGARPLGRVRALLLKQRLDVPAVALGGVSARHARWLKAAGFHGWAGIDAWLPSHDERQLPPGQKRRAVPI